MFGIYTDKHAYLPTEDVWVTIIAPDHTPVELMLAYNGYKQYIKIPETNTYPMNYLLPLPRNIEEGYYILAAAILHNNNPLRTQTLFQITYDTLPEKTVPTSKPGILILSEEVENTETYTPPQEPEYFRKENLESTEAQKQTAPETRTEVELPRDTGGRAVSGPIEVGKPVKWRKTVTVERLGAEGQEIDLLVHVPTSARNVVTKNPTARAFSASMEEEEIQIKDEFGTRREQTYTIEFETPGPTIHEDETFYQGDQLKKRVTISSPSDMEGDYEYRDVISRTVVDESPREHVRIIWYENGDLSNGRDITDEPTFDVKLMDTNDNGQIDLVSWITPHLSTQVFDVIIGMDSVTGDDVALDVNLLSPGNGEHINESPIAIHYRVVHNSSTTVSCSVFVDESLIDNVQNATGHHDANTTLLLEEGIHTWQVACTDNLGHNATSPTNAFVIDLASPSIELITRNNTLTLTGSITLNWSVQDNLALETDCEFYLDGLLNRSYMSVHYDTVQTTSFSGIANGTHSWNLECTDEAGNIQTSETYTFISYTEQEFNVLLDQPTYRIGEKGYFIITGPHGADVIVLIRHAESGESSIWNYYDASFPIITAMNFTTRQGEYTLRAVLNHLGAVKEINQTITVENNMHVNIRTTADTVEKDQSISFTAEDATGGIGEKTYTWDFKDDTNTATGTSVSHTFAKKGTFNVDLTMQDKYGNAKKFIKQIVVTNKQDVWVLVTDEQDHPIKDADVYIDDNKHVTNSNGYIKDILFPGEYTLLIQHPLYQNRYDEVEVTGNVTLTYKLKIKNIVNATNLTVINLSSAIIPAPTPSTKNNELQPTTIQTDGFDSAQLDELKEAVEKAKDNLARYSGLADEMALALKLPEKNKEFEAQIGRIERDLASINRITNSEERSTRITDIIGLMNTIRNELVIDIEAGGKYQFAQELGDDDIAGIIKSYLQGISRNLSKQALKEYQQEVKASNSKTIISTKAISGEITKMEGKEELTVIEQTIDSPYKITKEKIITAAPDVPISFKDDVTTDGKVLAGVNIIEHTSEEDTVRFTIADILSEEQAKQVFTIIMPTPKASTSKEDNGIFGVTGFAVFSSIAGVDDPILVIEIVLIILLILVYLTFQFNIASKILKSGLGGKLFSKLQVFGNKNMKRFAEIQEDFADMMANQKIAEAKKLADEARALASTIKGKNQETAQAIVTKLDEDLRVREIKDKINEALIFLKLDHRDKAAAAYTEIAADYKALPKNLKARIGKECTYLYEKLLSDNPFPKIKTDE